MAEKKEFKYTLHDDVNVVFDEKGNTFLALRKLTWGDNVNSIPKYDIRKWYVSPEGDEVVGKGVSFLTEDGPNNLTEALVAEGFGNTKVLLELINNRSDIDDEETFHDPLDFITE